MFKTNGVCLCLLLATAALAWGDPDGGQFKSDLSGNNEVPVVLTTGSGQVAVAPSSDQMSLSVTLNFSKLIGVAQSAGLYLGASGTSGGLVTALCGGSKPACPTTAEGTVTITLSSSDVLAIPAQGLAAGDLTSVLQALANGSIYINVLTSTFPNGEIRGQVGRGFSFGNGRGN
jgi:hypothetical protein